jgi:hypothetical protein
MPAEIKGTPPYVFEASVYLTPDPQARNVDAGYSPPKVVGVSREVLMGIPENRSISTSHMERLNLTTRMNVRRFTRLTNAFTKKLENLKAAVALHFAYYNFVRPHSTLGTTPATAAGITPAPWAITDLL